MHLQEGAELLLLQRVVALRRREENHNVIVVVLSVFGNLEGILNGHESHLASLLYGSFPSEPRLLSRLEKKSECVVFRVFDSRMTSVRFPGAASFRDRAKANRRTAIRALIRKIMMVRGGLSGFGIGFQKMDYGVSLRFRHGRFIFLFAIRGT